MKHENEAADKKNTGVKDITGQPSPAVPDEIIITPPVVLPIIAAGSNGTAASATKVPADDLDSGKNYTAAENEHDTNSTL